MQVDVAFYLGDPEQDGVLLETVTLTPISPGHVKQAFIHWDTTGLADLVEIYVVIDPLNAIAETSELNNIARRHIVIQPDVKDNHPPEATFLQVNDGAPSTDNPQLLITIEAEDYGDPASGVNTMYLMEREFNFAARQWVAIQHTDWIPFQSPYTMMLARDRGGMRRIQAWVADSEGNISNEAYTTHVDYMPPSDSVREGQARVYRRMLDVGQMLQVTLETLSGDADLHVWSPDGTQSWMSNGFGTGIDEVSFAAPEGGVYQIEVHGYQDSEYHLDIATGIAASEQMVQTVMHVSADKPVPGQPAIAPAVEPEEVAVPIAPIVCSIAGDMDHNGEVDVQDIMQVASRWRMTNADLDWDAHYDLNGDGIITIVDIMLVVANWGEHC